MYLNTDKEHSHQEKFSMAYTSTNGYHREKLHNDYLQVQGNSIQQFFYIVYCMKNWSLVLIVDLNCILWFSRYNFKRRKSSYFLLIGWHLNLYFIIHLWLDKFYCHIYSDWDIHLQSTDGNCRNILILEGILLYIPWHKPIIQYFRLYLLIFFYPFFSSFLTASNLQSMIGTST